MKKYFSLVLILAVLVGCANDSSSTTTQGSQSQNNGQQLTDPEAEWSKVSMDGFPEGGSYFQKQVIRIDTVKKTLVLTLPIQIVPLIQFPTYSGPSVPGVKVAFEQHPDGTRFITISVPLEHLIKGIILGTGSALPNGDPLPGFPDGEMPGTTVSIPGLLGWNLYLYIGSEAAAVFIEVPGLTLPGGIGGVFPTQITVPIKNKNKTKIVGYLSYIGPKTSSPGGAYIAAQLPRELAIILYQLLP
jgi:hypothetical protein